MIKKIEEMDFYDLLNLRIDASPKEIENAYLLAVTTYHQKSLASYGGLGEDDRRLMLDKVEEAFETLSDPGKKKAYDAIVLPRHPEFRQRAYFRRSIRKLEIEDATGDKRLWDKIRAVVRPSWLHGNGHGRSDKGGGRQRESLPEGFYYYGDYLKMVREKRGLTREQIAERCRVSPARIERLEEESSPSRPHGKELLAELKLYAQGLGFNSENGQAPPFSDRLDE